MDLKGKNVYKVPNACSKQERNHYHGPLEHVMHICITMFAANILRHPLHVCFSWQT